MKETITTVRDYDADDIDYAIDDYGEKNTPSWVVKSDDWYFDGTSTHSIADRILYGPALVVPVEEGAQVQATVGARIDERVALPHGGGQVVITREAYVHLGGVEDVTPEAIGDLVQHLVRAAELVADLGELR